MPGRLGDEALDQLFRAARTHGAWQRREVADDVLAELVGLMSCGPTSANMQPARLVFVRSAEAKARLVPHLSKGNRRQTLSAPVTVIIGHDLDFPELLPRLYPRADARSWFAGNDALIADSAFRNGTLQGAYLILAARALGLDVGPMSGFDNAGVDQTFFAGTRVRSNFIANLGYGDPAALAPRSPRLTFGDIARIV